MKRMVLWFALLFAGSGNAALISQDFNITSSGEGSVGISLLPTKVSLTYIQWVRQSIRNCICS